MEPPSTKEKRRNTLAALAASLAVSVLLGTVLSVHARRGATIDFQSIYFATRCLMDHHDPYNLATMKETYVVEAAGHAPGFIDRPEGVTWFVYPPTTFVAIVPFAVLGWVPSHIAWSVLLGSSFLLAACLISGVVEGVPSFSVVFLVCLVLANSEVLFGGGNAAGIVVSLCLIAVWCLLGNRFVSVGIVCMALALALKPHDAGLIWFYFLLACGTYRKRALQCLALCMLIGIIGAIWVSQVAPHWFEEWRYNLWATSAPGTGNDPGLSGGSGIIIDLRSAFAAIQDNPLFYNTVSYLIGGALLLVWLVLVFRSRLIPHQAPFALASAAPLTLLIGYHRPYDAKILLLMIPAYARLRTEGGRLGSMALAATSVGVLLTCDIPLTMLQAVGQFLHLRAAGVLERSLMIVVERPAPIALLAASVFYLWVFARWTREALAAEV